MDLYSINFLCDISGAMQTFARPMVIHLTPTPNPPAAQNPPAL
jgi:hypothetical protein